MSGSARRGRVGRWQRLRSDAGMATVEMAAALPVLMLLVLAGIYGVQVADARARAADAAREVARAAARGEPRAIDLGQQAVSGRGRVSVQTAGDVVVAVVTVRVRPLGPRLPELLVTERATAASEPGQSGVAGTVPVVPTGAPP